MDGWRRLLPLLAWLAALASGLVVFHALGRGVLAPPPLTDPGAWAAWAGGREPAVAAAAVLRLVVLALGWYLVGVTTVGLAARLARAARLVRVADAVTLPRVRRLLQGALGLSLATAMVGASAAGQVRDLDGPRLRVAHEQPAGQAPAPDGRATSAPLSMRLVEQDEPRAAPEGRQARGARPDGPRPAEPATHRIVAGESLWSIARDALARQGEREPTDAEVLPYWRDVIEANRAHLPDADNPDLIFPGDHVVLPAPPASG